MLIRSMVGLPLLLVPSLFIGETKNERTERYDFNYRRQRQDWLPAGQAFGIIIYCGRL